MRVRSAATADRLRGGHVIAKYVDLPVKMIYDLAKQGRVPVYRLVDKEGAMLYASRAKLDAWLIERSSGVSNANLE